MQTCRVTQSTVWFHRLPRSFVVNAWVHNQKGIRVRELNQVLPSCLPSCLPASLFWCWLPCVFFQRLSRVGFFLSPLHVFCFSRVFWNLLGFDFETLNKCKFFKKTLVYGIVLRPCFIKFDVGQVFHMAVRHEGGMRPANICTTKKMSPFCHHDQKFQAQWPLCVGQICWIVLTIHTSMQISVHGFCASFCLIILILMASFVTIVLWLNFSTVNDCKLDRNHFVWIWIVLLVIGLA